MNEPNLLENYIDTLLTADLLNILKDFESFRKTGVTGDTYLRSFTDDFLSTIGPSSQRSTAMWLTMVGCEAYRILARRSFSSSGANITNGEVVG